MPQKIQPSFTELLRELPGSKLRENKNKLGSCPECFSTIKRSGIFLVCTNCGYKKIIHKDANNELSYSEIMALPTHVFGRKDHCFYCGEPPDARDHVIPWSFLSVTETRGSRPGPRCYACSDCNRRLSSRFFLTLRERAAAAQSLIRTAFKKELRLPEWTEKELNEMGYTLREHIKARQALRVLTEQRLEWPETATSKALWVETEQIAVTNYQDNPWIYNFFTKNPYENR